MDAVLRKQREKKLTIGNQMEEKRTKERTTENKCKSGDINWKKKHLKGREKNLRE